MFQGEARVSSIEGKLVCKGKGLQKQSKEIFF